MPARTKVFVYGTLRYGMGAHRMLRDSEYLGVTETEDGFALMDMGSCPAMVPAAAGRVRGEVYLVDPATLADLDRYESHPRLYRRTPIGVEDFGVVAAYVWVGRALSGDVVLGGDWTRLMRQRGGLGPHDCYRDVEEDSGMMACGVCGRILHPQDTAAGLR